MHVDMTILDMAAYISEWLNDILEQQANVPVSHRTTKKHEATELPRKREGRNQVEWYQKFLQNGAPSKSNKQGFNGKTHDRFGISGPCDTTSQVAGHMHRQMPWGAFVKLLSLGSGSAPCCPGTQTFLFSMFFLSLNQGIHQRLRDIWAAK